MMLQGKGKGQRFNKKNNPTLQFLEAATSQTQQLAQASRGVRLGGRMSRGKGGGGVGGGGRGGGGGGRGGGGGAYVPRVPRPPQAPGGGGGGGGTRSGRGLGYGGGFDMAGFAFGMTVGQGLSQPLTMAILSGFQLGVGLLQKGFEYVSNSFSERVEDQMTDLQAAGGYYSIADRQKNPMFTSLQQAVIFTQKTNDVLERLAGDLPGSTEDYVKVSKRIGDSVMRLVDSNEKGAIQYAKQLMDKGQLQESYRGVSLEGPNAREGATQVILGELTKKTVLAGFGGQTGRGGAAGAYGLPALMERLITNPDTSMAQLQKYAAVFGDPKIMSALDRAMPELKKAGSDMLSRTKVINSMLDEISPPEMISAMRKSMAGVLEAYRSAFFSPGTGLFGFGRKLKDASGKLQPLTDVYGRFINIVEKNGKQVEVIVDSASKAKQVDLDVFNMFADIISNYAAILKPIVDNLYLIWDPMQGIADALRKARIISAEVLQTFRNYTDGLEDLAKGMPNEKLREMFLSTKRFRATLLTISNIFAEMGIFSDADFFKLQKIIIDPKTSMGGLGDVLKSLTETFLNSDAAAQVGKFVGTLVKEVVIILADITTFGEKLGASKLASGFVEGFGDQGFKALERLFANLYAMIFSALGKVIEEMPGDIKAKLIGYALTGLGLVAGVAAIGMAIGSGLSGVFSAIAMAVKDRLLNLSSETGKHLAKLKSSGRTGLMLGGLGAGIKPNAKTTGISNAAFRPVGPRPPKGFEHIALPGKAPSMTGGVTSPGRAPAIGKPIAPLKRTPFGALSNIKAKGVSAVAASMISLSTQSPKLAKASAGIKEFGKGAVQVAKKIPGLSVAVGALDFGLRKASGQGTGEAAGGAIGAGLGAAGGAFLGSALGPAGTLAGGVLGSFLGDWLGSNIGKALENLPQTLSGAWSGFVSWVQNLPVNVGYALGAAKANMESTFQNFLAWWGNLGKEFGNAMNRLGWQIRGMWEKFKKTLSEVVSGKFDWAALANSLSQTIWNIIKGGIDGVRNFAGGIGNWFSGLGKGFEAGYRETKGGYTSTQTQQRQAGGAPASPLFEWRAKGGLGDAIASEMRMKPPGSNLVVANSSETVIPAAGGYGMKKFISTLYSGFHEVSSQVASVKAGSLTSNSSGGFGGSPITIHAPITIHQQPGQSTDELASLVAIKIGEAVADARSSSIFV